MEYEPLPSAIAAFARAEMERLEVPGVAAAAIYDGHVYAQGFGVTNVDHPLPVTPETLFQIGSTSKTFTATVLMTLVEEGRVSLEARVRDYLPDFRLQSEEDAARMTLRHLVTHHGGWAGDYFRDTGRGDDALARIVGKMANSAQLLPAGTAFSYNNAGFYVLGRIIEAVTGETFEGAVAERIFRPLGMETSTYFPEDTIVHAPAAGHIRTPAGLKVANPWRMPRSIGPGGGIISNVLEQLQYAAFHMGDETAPGGARILRRETLELMQTPQAEAGSMCAHVGVSWMLDTIDGVRIVKHGGATNGHLSAFELVPARRFGVTVLTDSDSGRELRQTVAEAIREHFTGIRRPEIVPAAGLPGDASEYIGRYEATLADLTVQNRDGGLEVAEGPPAKARARGAQVPFDTPAEPIVFVAPDRAVVAQGPRRGEGCEFLRDSSGAVGWMRWDGRVARRVEG